MGAKRYSCQAPVGAGLERPPPSGDRWLRPVDLKLGGWIGARHLWRRKQPSSTSTVSLSTATLSTSTTKSDARHERADEWR
jgi:hypothetical protein